MFTYSYSCWRNVLAGALQYPSLSPYTPTEGLRTDLNLGWGRPCHLLNKPSYLEELIFDLRGQTDPQSPRSR